MKVSRGSCPCLVRPARELSVPEVHDCPVGKSNCPIEGVADPFALGVSEDPVSSSPAGITIHHTDLCALFGWDLGDVLFLVASATVWKTLTIAPQGAVPLEIIRFVWRGPHSRQELISHFSALHRVGRRATALWIADDEFEHYLPEHLENVKLGAISYFSYPFTAESLAQYLTVLRNTDYAEELSTEEALLHYLEDAPAVEFVSHRYGTKAVFEHSAVDNWFSLHGPLAYGQQVVLPTGELAALTNPSGQFSMASRFPLNGSIVLKGEPIVHRGGRDISVEDTARMYDAMSSMREYPVVVEVADGLIKTLHSPVSGKNPFLDTLTLLFESDPRYRKVHEIGFGTNRQCGQMIAANFFPNERWPGVHFGLGLGGHTSFHLDLACVDLDVYVETPNNGTINVYEQIGLREHRSSLLLAQVAG
jgi:hypothetical protein